MKKLGILFAASLALAGFAFAMTVVYNATLVNETGLAYNKTYDVNLADKGIDNVSAQAVYSTATISAVSFSSTSITMSTSLITKANALTTALPILYTTTSGTAPSPLVTNTTYYASNVSATSFKISTTSAQAQAGTYITLLSSGTGSYSVAPLAYTGTAALTWQGSNDGTNFSTVNISTSGINYTGNLLWDFGTLDYRVLRLSVTAPTTGGLVLKVVVNGKNTNR